MKKCLSWLVILEVSVHDGLALLFVAIGEQLIMAAVCGDAKPLTSWPGRGLGVQLSGRVVFLMCARSWLQSSGPFQKEVVDAKTIRTSILPFKGTPSVTQTAH